MCPPYHEEFTPVTTHRPKVRQKRYLNRALKGQVLSMNHALFLPSTLEMVRNVVHDAGQRPYLETDLKLLTGEAESNIPWYVDRLLELYHHRPFSMIDQISEGELHRDIDQMNCGFSPKAASEALWGMEIELSDHDLPFDQLSWGLNYLQKHEYLPDRNPEARITPELGGHALVIELIEGLADRLLINQNGSHHLGRINQLKRYPGVEHAVLEQDSHGPLRCGLITTKGTICYG